MRNQNFVPQNDSESENDEFVGNAEQSDDSGVSEDINHEKVASKKRKIKAKDGNKSKKHKKMDGNLTVEEINEMKEADELYHSNLFRMQIDETLKEVKLNFSQEEFVHKWLATFKKFLNKIFKSIPPILLAMFLSILK